MSIDALGIHLFGILYIRFYALILIAGMLVALWLTARRAPAAGLDPKYLWDGFFWVLIPGIIGARLYHVLTPSPASGLDYLRNPLQIFAIWNGGLGIYGAVAGGAIGAYFYGRHHKQPILRWFDLIAPGLILAQAIGRWGNFVNQELYGPPTDLPWGILIDRGIRVPPFDDLLLYPLETTRFHPLFLYESLWNVGACLLLLFIGSRFRDRLRPGDVFLGYVLLYTTIRFLLDFIRPDSHMSGALTTAQLIALGAFLAAAFALILRPRQNTTPTPPAG